MVTAFGQFSFANPSARPLTQPSTASNGIRGPRGPTGLPGTNLLSLESSISVGTTGASAGLIGQLRFDNLEIQQGPISGPSSIYNIVNFTGTNDAIEVQESGVYEIEYNYNFRFDDNSITGQVPPINAINVDISFQGNAGDSNRYSTIHGDDIIIDSNITGTASIYKSYHNKFIASIIAGDIVKCIPIITKTGGQYNVTLLNSNPFTQPCFRISQIKSITI